MRLYKYSASMAALYMTRKKSTDDETKETNSSYRNVDNLSYVLRIAKLHSTSKYCGKFRGIIHYVVEARTEIIQTDVEAIPGSTFGVLDKISTYLTKLFISPRMFSI